MISNDDDDITQNDERVYKLVRLAIASEYNKKGLRRDEIVDKVSTTMRRAPVFKKVMEWANKKLSDDFGFELVPLPVVTGMSVASAKTNQSRRAVVTRKAKAENSKSAPPQTFGLISNLLQNQRAMLPRASRDKVATTNNKEEIEQRFLEKVQKVLSLQDDNI